MSTANLHSSHGQFSLTTKLTLTATLTVTDTVKLISQSKLGGELLPERQIFPRYL